MTCYFRHIGPVFDELDIVVTSENKKEIDERIHEIVGVQYKNCSEAWKKFKELRSNNEKVLMTELKEKLSETS